MSPVPSTGVRRRSHWGKKVFLMIVFLPPKNEARKDHSCDQPQGRERQKGNAPRSPSLGGPFSLGGGGAGRALCPLGRGGLPASAATAFPGFAWISRWWHEPVSLRAMVNDVKKNGESFQQLFP